MKRQLLLVYIFLFSFQFAQSQFFEGFENTTGPDVLPSTNWTLGSGNWLVFDNGVGPGRWGINNTIAAPPLFYAGSNAAYMNREQTGGANITSEDYLATPIISVPANGKLSFYSRTFTQGNQGTFYKIKVCSASSLATNPANYTTIATFTEDQISSTFNIYEKKIVSLPPNLIGTQVRIAFVRENTQLGNILDGDRWLLDNVSIYEGCLEPTALTTAGVFFNSANLVWTNPSGATSWEIEVLPAATNPTGFGVTYSGGLPYLASTTSYGSPLVQTPLTTNTAYKYFVRAICNGNITSEWVGPFNFTTTTAPPVCGGNFVDNGGPTGNYTNNANQTTTICPTVPGELVSVTFTSFNTELNTDTLSIYDGNSTAAPLLGTFSGNTLPPILTSSATNGCLTFVFESNGSITSDGWVANINCNPIPCPQPIDLTAFAITSNTVNLVWTNTSSGTTWQYLLLPQGSPPPSAAILGIPVSTNPFLITGLTSDTCYNVYVKNDCSSTLNGLSNWSNPLPFCTLAFQSVCGGTFIDQGGVSENYPNNSNSTVTICPFNAGDAVTVTFTSFDTEATFDALYVFDGPSIIAPQIASPNSAGNVPGGIAGGFWGTTNPGSFTSSHPSGCLTFRFRSNDSITYSGWLANVNCAPITNKIILIAFLDSNNNGIQDTGEMAFTEGSFVSQLNDSGVNNYITSANGYHQIIDFNTTNSYDFSYQINSEYATYFSSTTTYSNIVNTNGIQNLYFPIAVTNPYIDVSVTINSSTPVPGFTYTNYIIYKNNGYSTTSGTLNFVNDPAVTITSIYQSGTTPTATGFNYNYSNLLPNETRYLTVTMSIPSIPIVNLGTTLTNNASITPTVSDVNVANNSFSSSRIVVGSYDPNDKSEAHGPQIQFNQFTVNDYLYYTVNFQNEGTANAITVRIEDLLDAQIDETSIRMVDASHPYTMLRTNSQITWTFENINLPPKSVSEPLSKGYVLFKVKLKPGFAIGDIVPNTAEIYFDFNPAIITNTFTTQFVALNTIDFASNNFVIFPNPATSNITLLLQNTSETIESIAITDVLGKTIQSNTSISNQQAQIDVTSFSRGIYFVEITTATKLKQVKKLVIE